MTHPRTPSPAKRRQPTPRQVLLIVMQQVRVRNGRAVLMCPLCGDPIEAADWPKVIREHLHALELGGEDTPSNQAFVHPGCAGRKTTGRSGDSPLSSAGNGDISRIAKVRRLQAKRAGKARVVKKIPARPLSNPKLKRRFDGKVVAR